jgi:nitrate/TMAO reductase-like tetraheme cytochrome c subunit
MPEERDEDREPGLWTRLWRRPAAKWTLGIPVGALVALVVGAGALLGAQGTIHATSSNEFCATACHSHAEFIDPEWRSSEHYHNRTGVLAGCADCHIPHEYPDKLIVKTKMGITDIYQEFVARSISTRERYEAKREEMAEAVWARMRANDSKACRTCHSPERFDPEEQSAAARASHQALQTGQVTCIDCHTGVAHLTPTEAQEKFGLPEAEEPADEAAAPAGASRERQATGMPEPREAAQAQAEADARYRGRAEELEALVEDLFVGPEDAGATADEAGEGMNGDAASEDAGAGQPSAASEGAAAGRGAAGGAPDGQQAAEAGTRPAEATAARNEADARPQDDAGSPPPAGSPPQGEPGAALREQVRRTFVEG